MTTESKKDKSSSLKQIVIAVVIAILVGGTSPWWWVEIFSNKNSPNKDKTGQDTLIGNTVIDSSKNIDSKIWKEGKLTIPFNNLNSGAVADLDNGKLIILGTSLSDAGGDISIRQSVHSIVFEPGLSKGDGVTFDARFIAVNDSPVGKGGCLASLISPIVLNHLKLLSDIDVGSHICIVTSDGRLAEFSITKLNLSDSSRNVEIEYVVWLKE